METKDSMYEGWKSAQVRSLRVTYTCGYKGCLEMYHHLYLSL